MFQEEEPGKPQNWCFTVTFISIIILINVIIFVVIRVLLDTENEFDEPIIDGELRENLTQFLGFFALSFCFGCWCCFCCNGKCFKCLYFLNPKRWRLGHWWEIFIGHQFIHSKTNGQTNVKQNSQEENLKDLSKNQINENDCENGILPKNDRRGRQKISRISETDYDIERKVSPIFMSSTLSEAMEENCETEEKKFKNPINFISGSKNILNENKMPTMPWCSTKVGIRRWSLAHQISSENLIKMIEEREAERGIKNSQTGNIQGFKEERDNFQTRTLTNVNKRGTENPAYEMEEISS